MRLWQIGLIVFVVAGLVAHFFLLLGLPSTIMSKARDALMARGSVVHEWAASPQMTPQTQTIVRPSPDLAYAVCLFDVTGGPVEISAPTWDGYASLALFDRRTNNVFTTSLDSAIDAPRGVIVASKDADIQTDAYELPVIVLDKEGIAVIRRLAPGVDIFETAQSLVAGATCSPIELES